MTPIYRLRLSHQIGSIPISDIPPFGYTWIKNKVCALFTFSPPCVRKRLNPERPGLEFSLSRFISYAVLCGPIPSGQASLPSSQAGEYANSEKMKIMGCGDSGDKAALHLSSHKKTGPP